MSPLRFTPIATAFLAATLLAGASGAAASDTAKNESGIALTVYSSADPAGFDPQRFIAQQRKGADPAFAWQVPGFGVVKEVRSVDLTAGLNDLPFTDVAQFIDPTTVSFTDLTDPDGTTVLEQNFRFDLVSPAKLLGKYIDRSITVHIPAGDTVEEVSGVLMSATAGSLVLKTPDGLRVINGLGQSVQLGELPDGLLTKPTLVWKLNAAKTGTHTIRTTYQTGGITWRSDYNLVINPDDTQADLGAWVTLMNLSGKAYRDARLKLIAGDVQRIQPQAPRSYKWSAGRNLGMAFDAATFEEKSFFEYHLYTLPRRTDVLANTTQQITLFPTARNVGVEKVLVYSGLPQAAHWPFGDSPRMDRNIGNQSNKKLDVYVRFKNKEPNNLGMPLPKGKVRVYKEDSADGTLEFIGEDLIDHTAKNETVLIKLGQSFDVVGERTQTDFTAGKGRRTMTESFKIEIRNHKDKPQKVVIKENLFRWMTWKITRSSDDFEKIDARTVHFNVTVPANGEKTVTYTVRYKW